jgi:diguanylate cyclase (GGDEF)-like protein
VTDPLTGLPLHRELPAALAGATPLALWVDVDGLIWLNDQLGHAEGDAALAAVARELCACVESGVFRVGGDEFLVVVPMLAAPAALKLGAELVRRVRALAIPYRRTNRPEQTSLEVNVALVRLTKAFVEQLISRTMNDLLPQAIYEAKQQHGRPGVVVDLSAR